MISLVSPLPLPGAEYRDTARRDWEVARASGYDQWVLAEQHRLAEAGWAGTVIDMPQRPPGVPVFPTLGEWNEVSDAMPPALAELRAKAVAASAVIGVQRPGDGKDATWQQMEAGAVESRQRASADAVRVEQAMAGARIYFGAPDSG